MCRGELSSDMQPSATSLLKKCDRLFFHPFHHSSHHISLQVFSLGKNRKKKETSDVREKRCDIRLVESRNFDSFKRGTRTQKCDVTTADTPDARLVYRRYPPVHAHRARAGREKKKYRFLKKRDQLPHPWSERCRKEK